MPHSLGADFLQSFSVGAAAHTRQARWWLVGTLWHGYTLSPGGVPSHSFPPGMRAHFCHTLILATVPHEASCRQGRHPAACCDSQETRSPARAVLGQAEVKPLKMPDSMEMAGKQSAWLCETLAFGTMYLNSVVPNPLTTPERRPFWDTHLTWPPHG